MVFIIRTSYLPKRIQSENHHVSVNGVTIYSYVADPYLPAVSPFPPAEGVFLTLGVKQNAETSQWEYTLVAITDTIKLHYLLIVIQKTNNNNLTKILF